MLPYRSLKRGYDTFSEASGGRTDWLCDPDVKLRILNSILPPTTTPVKIMIPGIGHSTLGRDLLMDLKYDVTVADFDEDQVSDENKQSFATINYFDLLKTVPEKLVSKFDYVIDSSVTDVFMQLTTGSQPNLSNAKKGHAAMLSMLKPYGTMVVFSMNKDPWEEIYQRKEMNRMHLRIRPIFHIVTQRGRMTEKPGEDVLVLVSSNRQLDDLRPVKGVNADFGSVTEWTNELPEDWKSQRD